MAIYLDDAVMNGKKDVLSYLKLDDKTIPTTRRKELEVLGGKKDKDGNMRICKSIYGVAEYSVYVPMLGREVKVRLASNRRPTKDNGFSYTPKNIGIEPAEDGSVLLTDELEFIFWFLRPMNRQSPFRKVNQKAYYEFKDNDAKAVLEGEIETTRMDAMSMIYGSNRRTFKELRELAKGMNMAGVDDMTDAVVQSNLKKLIDSDPIAFYNKANSREIIFSGKVQQAIDMDVLTIRNINGMKRWFLLNDEILPLQHGVDEVKALKELLSTQWYIYADQFEAAVQGRDIQANLANPANDLAFEQHESFKAPESKSELNATTIQKLKEIEADPYLKEKVEKYMNVDVEDPSVHAKTKEAYHKHKEYIDAYIESKKGL